ncbi:MAG: TlpA family protein disulfide reductase [Paracoccaceae bacterium]|nr:TlpA family protein disulfide reductase [Paracoccaceae bacterium]
MNLVRCAMLYAGFALCANAALADQAAVEALRKGDMEKLVFVSPAKPLPDAVLLDADDAPQSLEKYRGTWVVLNFWATWCAPCRAEMPSLDRLQAMMGDTVAVVPVATGPNSLRAITDFYNKAEIKNLPVLRDPKQALAARMAVMGLPLTVILNPEGQEIARLIGDAEWDSDSARAILDALVRDGI